MSNFFIIVGTQRTGSSAFANALARHPGVFVGWEWILNIPAWRKLAVAKQATKLNFENLVDAHRKHIEAEYRQQQFVGFRWLFRSSAKWMDHPRLAPALMLDRLEGFLDWARRDSHLRVIHIVRNDHMGWLLSKEMARSSGIYVGKEYPKGLKVAITIKEALKRIQSKVWVDSRLGSLADTGRYFRVRFEDFAANNDQVARGALAFLGCNLDGLTNLEATIRRQSHSADSGDGILNYEQLQAALSERGLLMSSF